MASFIMNFCFYCYFIVAPTITGVDGFVFEPFSIIHQQQQHSYSSLSSMPSIRLFAQSNEDTESTSSPRIRFNNNNNNGNDDDNNNSNDNMMSNPIDRFLTLLASDSFSIVSGTIGLLIVVLHRWTMILAIGDADPTSLGSTAAVAVAAETLTYQTRTDLLAVFACGSVLLNGVTQLDVTTALAESVVLEGINLSEPEQITSNEKDNSKDDDSTLSWALQSLLVATPAKTAVLITATDDDQQQWTIRSRAGIVPSSSTTTTTTSVPKKAPILDRVGSPNNSKETYLPTLQALPGRAELTYLPTNSQLAVLIPIASSSDDKNNSVLVLGGNRAKSFSPRDIAWSRIVAERLGEYL
jgi:hypothetical protein